jgi:perosamine synthetase
MIPLSKVVVDAETETLVLQTLRSGQLAQGPMVERFEQHCREMAGTAHAVAVNNGTTALELALKVAGVGPGDEVITSPFTFAATVNAIVHSGATVVFADIARDFTIDPELISALITDRTSAIMPVHLYGLPADMTAINRLAQQHQLRIIEDAAQAHGATVNGQSVGGADLATFSFYATKNLATGEGGVVTTNSSTDHDRMRVLRNQGMRARYQYEEPGFNMRMMDLVAALAISQFEQRPAMEARRRQNAAVLTAGLTGVEGLELPNEPPDRSSVWHQYTVRITQAAHHTRDDVMKLLQERGVGCGVYYPFAAYDYDCFRSHPQIRWQHCPQAESAAAEVLSIPVHQHLSDTDLDVIVETLRSVMQGS